MTALRVTGGGPVGCVLRIDTGVAEVITDAGECRASFGPRMLGTVARDRSQGPQAGDWVRLRHWSDGRTTIEECLTAPVRAAEPPSAAPGPPSATVLAFRRP